MPDKHNYMKTRPFRSDSSRELARGEGQKIIFQNSHHEDTISETITTNHNLHHNYNLIKTRDLEQVKIEKAQSLVKNRFSRRN